ncbi:MAG: hypothetical protein DDT22_00564 [candidate division WS2 bacterium]|nr:hypothetical protein [Candidatus Lithacetigena glycinireducens]
MLVKALAKTFSLTFKRIQFTPDLMPADITGTHLLIEKEGVREFVFMKGPIFSHLLLADEINRATPKVQSALLEAMQERTVTAGETTYPLPNPFFVVATQNPIEMEGTYPLPEAQLDRFSLKILIPFPNLETLRRIGIETFPYVDPKVEKVGDEDLLREVISFIELMPVAPEVVNYASRLVLASHPEGDLAPFEIRKFARYGSSPRGVQVLLRAGKVKAMLEDRPNLSFSDIQAVAYPVLRHRLILNFEGEAERVGHDSLIEKVIERVRI